jgi:hypothetical protein
MSDPRDPNVVVRGHGGELVVLKESELEGLAAIVGRRRARPPRGPGRPAWTVAEFDARYRSAVETAGPGATLDAIARHFRPLERLAWTGEPRVGIRPDTLQRLLERRRRGELAP